MRVLVAPDSFGGALSASEAARAIAAGWARHAPGDELDLVPLSDGGPGFLDAVRAARGGDLLARTVEGPFGEPVPATVLLVGDTAYVEGAQACGLQLTGGRRGERASSTGLGQLVAAAVAEVGAGGEVVVGLGGLGTHDGGAGMLGALGAAADRPLDVGVAGLAGVRDVELSGARERLHGVRLRGACETTAVLAGLFGTTKASGASRGVPEERLPSVDAVLDAWGAATGRLQALEERSGAGGGSGYALRLLGAELNDGLDLLAGEVGLARRARGCEVVLTGEASLDFSGRSGRVPAAVARVAADVLAPCVVLAGRVVLGRRELRAQGFESAYSVEDVVGARRATDDPAGALADLAARVARSWSV